MDIQIVLQQNQPTYLPTYLPNATEQSLRS